MFHNKSPLLHLFHLCLVFILTIQDEHFISGFMTELTDECKRFCESRGGGLVRCGKDDTRIPGTCGEICRLHDCTGCQLQGQILQCPHSQAFSPPPPIPPTPPPPAPLPQSSPLPSYYYNYANSPFPSYYYDSDNSPPQHPPLPSYGAKSDPQTPSPQPPPLPPTSPPQPTPPPTSPLPTPPPQPPPLPTPPPQTPSPAPQTTRPPELSQVSHHDGDSESGSHPTSSRPKSRTVIGIFIGVVLLICGLVCAVACCQKLKHGVVQPQWPQPQQFRQSTYIQLQYSSCPSGTTNLSYQTSVTDQSGIPIHYYSA